MANCTGIIYGFVRDTNGAPIPGVDVSLNWVQRAEGGALKVGGDDDLKTYVPNCSTTKAGEYVIPFFWESVQVPGDSASALVMRYYSNGTYTPLNKRGQLFVGLDVRKLIGIAAPPIPSSGATAASMFLKFFMAATPELKGMGILTRFVGSTKFMAVELQGCFSNIEFVL